jgi:hypothetical protein
VKFLIGSCRTAASLVKIGWGLTALTAANEFIPALFTFQIRYERYTRSGVGQREIRENWRSAVGAFLVGVTEVT